MPEALGRYDRSILVLQAVQRVSTRSPGANTDCCVTPIAVATARLPLRHETSSQALPARGRLRRVSSLSNVARCGRLRRQLYGKGGHLVSALASRPAITVVWPTQPWLRSV
jgi:hypothetical protein